VNAITIPRSGGPEVLTWQTVPDPEPAAGEVLVDVTASAVNRADLMQRQGFYPPPAGAPPYPGLECSGRIAAVGDGVTGWQVGDEVCALLAGGGYATRVAVPAGQVLSKPAAVSLRDAAALPEVACTVWSNVGQLAHLSKGETFLVHGGGSGIGTHAIQVAKALGAIVLCTAGTPEKLARCRELGADVTINYRTEDFVARAREETGGGVDVILDMIGAKYLTRNVEALAANGRLAIIGLQGGARAEIDLNALMRTRAQVIGTVLRARPAAEKAAIVTAVRERVWPLVESGAVRPVVDRVLPMRDAAGAHRVVEAGQNIGKVVLET
jgi:putative PIG3 family NAD(P)H quinone oxidoreductase